MLVFKKSKSHDTRERGNWCNRCGLRLQDDYTGLARAVPGDDTLPDVPLGRARWLTIGKARPPWSLCPRCYEERVCCTACGMPVGAEGVLHEGGSHLYCRHCYRQDARCDTCGLPAGVHPHLRPDGRVLCRLCHTTAVVDPAT